MSYFHSEIRKQHLQLTVRVKLLNLNQGSTTKQEAANPVEGSLSIAVDPQAKSSRHGVPAKPTPQGGKAECVSNLERPPVGLAGICFDLDRRLAEGEMEKHIETCPVCANRLELQLDFVECLETAIYQRLSEPDSAKIHGALMVSAPKMNFAICGELELG